MAASIRHWILIIAIIVFSLFIFNRWIVIYFFDDVLRARALRFQLTCVIVTFLSAIAVFNWVNLSTIFDGAYQDSNVSTETSRFQFPIQISWREISNWKQYTVKSALWRGFLMTILISSVFAYSSFSLLISSDPYIIGYFFMLCFAISVQLFSALVVILVLKITLKMTCKKTLRISKRPSKLPKILSVLYALGIVTMGFFNTFKIPEIREVNIQVKGLPSHLNKLTITFVSDIHLGPTVGKQTLEKIVHMINYLHSDVVIIGGDLVDGRVDQLSLAVEPLDWIKSKYGTYFVTGNHEYYTADVHNWFTKLQSLGVKILHNSNVVIKGNGESGICLAGVDDPTANSYQFMGHKMDMDGALKTCDRDNPVILVAHQPATAKKALQSDYRVDLVLSGHTHGGQMFPLTIGAYLFNPYYAGLYSYGEHSHVYVSMGAAYWGFPVRFGTKSEIIKITLVSK